jgi:hypothetical protein
LEPPSTLIHITERAPVLSATFRDGLHLNHLFSPTWPATRSVLEPARGETLDRMLLSGAVKSRNYTPVNENRKTKSNDGPFNSSLRLTNPRLGPGQRPRFNWISTRSPSFASLPSFVSMVLLGTHDDLAVQRVLDATFDQDRHRLVHLVADDAPDQRTLDLLLVSLIELAFSRRSVRTRAMSRRTLLNLAVVRQLLSSLLHAQSKTALSEAPAAPYSIHRRFCSAVH